ncbi:nitroreductase family protein [Lacrimispora saccharolytica]|uniref:Nitroreductase n=1 Tax=Lacrimispora saccharolytica (strain ATCC 35040 / DSM 2544 / NRCC 2533 / WM1) TaxID=610130 RepID=D9R983_LACSW|nr:nitroreductase family protein [Lacrimispora saccharolytica]ADL05834.1 nitroreductase [[Clostridium] saccharolyticum WM1]QRV20033.1 nitroreductase family protein [Lacrimispora saccharolytica]
MNETLKVIGKRYSCRDYKKDMLPDEILQAIAEAAIQAPSGMNRQAWRVIVVKDQDLMNDLETEGLSYLAAMEDQSLYNKIIEHGGRLFYGAPCMIVVPIDPEQYAPALIDCGILCQNITLAATSLGIANIMCGFTGLAFASGTRSAEFSKRLGFPDDYVFGCSVLLGYANTEVAPHSPDKSKISFIEYEP